MARNKKPRKAYRPRPVTAETMRLVINKVSICSRADRAEIIGVLAKAIRSLREGVATELEWSIAAGAVAAAIKIEAQGVVRGLREHLHTAEQALQHIYDRAMRAGAGRWLRPTLYWNEIEALNVLLDLHTFQLSQLGRSELLAVLDATVKQTHQDGHVATVVTNIETLSGIAA